MDNLESDRELLELSAKAAGYKIEFHNISGECIRYTEHGVGVTWAPLTDNADSERLRHALNISLDFERYNGDYYACAYPHGTHQGYDEVIADNSTEAGMLAANRAIVRAAAAIGKAMQ